MNDLRETLPGDNRVIIYRWDIVFTTSSMYIWYSETGLKMYVLRCIQPVPFFWRGSFLLTKHFRAILLADDSEI